MRTKYIVRKVSKEKELAIWYYGKGVIAEVVHLNRKIVIKSPDCIRIIDNNGKRLRNSKAFRTLELFKLSSDSELYKRNMDKFFYEYFGEFDFVYINLLNGAEELLSNDEVLTYTKAIKYAQSTIKNDKFWINTNKQIKKVTTIDVNMNWLSYVIYEETFVPLKRSCLRIG
ncbi:MAG: hypothetical protein IKA83_04000 [Paludibacteraceae bacterium]|nr:hypothetical protein [Paludibacteraceae bacterium]